MSNPHKQPPSPFLVWAKNHIRINGRWTPSVLDGSWKTRRRPKPSNGERTFIVSRNSRRFAVIVKTQADAEAKFGNL
jgi:hypothetical protein